jgi:hypothetical protein
VSPPLSASSCSREYGGFPATGPHAAAHFANLGAIAHLERGLGLLRSLPESPARNSREIALQLALGLCLYSAKNLDDFFHRRVLPEARHSAAQFPTVLVAQPGRA